MEAKLIQITSPKSGEQCDLYPHLSIHKAILSNDFWKPIDRCDFIPKEFKVSIIEDLAMKQCNGCNNNFPEQTDFIEDKCIRCFERKYIPGEFRDRYRDILIRSITNK